MDGGSGGGHGEVDRWNPHVPLTDGLADIGHDVCDAVVAARDILAVDFVIL